MFQNLYILISKYFLEISSFKGWYIKNMKIILATIVTMISFNLLIDPMDIFRLVSIKNINTEKTKAENYQRLFKFYQVTQFKPDTIILGTSRGGILQAKDVAKYTNDRVYNLSFGAATPLEQYWYAKYCINNLGVKRIILTVDFFQYNPNLKPAPDFDLSRFSSNIYIADYVKLLLSYDAFKLSFAMLVDNMLGKKALNCEDGSETSETQKMFCKLDERQRKNNFDNTLDGFRKTSALYGSDKFKSTLSINEGMKYFNLTHNEIIKAGIDLKVVVLPIHSEQYDLIHKMGLGKTYETWKKNITKTTGFWDFSGYNCYTVDKRHFRDSSHMMPEVGSAVIERILNDKNNTICNDFGVFYKKLDVD